MPENEPEDKKAEAEKDKADPVKNLKSEMDRKFQNFQDQLKATLDEVKAVVIPPAPRPEKIEAQSFKDLFYQDEEAAATQLKEQTKKEIREELEGYNRQAQVLTSLHVDFPELGDKDHALTKRAVEIHKMLPPKEQLSPSSYRLAVLEAANELSVTPQSKRKKEADTDDYTGAASGGGGGAKRASANTLANETLVFAQAMGLNVDDKELVDRLKASSKRIWTKYRPV